MDDVDTYMEVAAVSGDLSLVPEAAVACDDPLTSPEHQRGFAILQALVQRGGLEGFEHALRTRDDGGGGFLTLHDMRAILIVRNFAAAGDTDYRRYRVVPVPRLVYQMTMEELDDLVSLASKDLTGRRINYVEIVELGASLMEVEGLKQLLSEGFVQILPQSPDEVSTDEDGGYAREVLERNRLTATGLAPPPAAASGGEINRTGDTPAAAPPTAASVAAVAASAVKPPRLMPMWWLCWQQFFWFTQFLTFSLLLNILLPFRVLALVGGENKAEWLAFLNTAVNFVALTSPILGALSDATRTRFGRRRPYVFCGQLLCCFGLGLMNIAPSMYLLTAALIIYVLGNNFSCAIYASVVPELVPPDQRGTAGGFFMLFQTLGNLFSSVVGYMVGDAFITEGQAYGILILLNALDLVVALVGLGQVPGIFTAEAPSPAEEDDDALPKKKIPGGSSSSSSSSPTAVDEAPSLSQKICGFLSAFTSRSFTCLFFFMFCAASFGTITNIYLGYWVQDRLGGPSVSAPSYALFGWHLTSSAQSGTAMLIAVNSCAQAPMNVIGGALSDRIGKRALLVFAVVLQVWCPVVQAYTSSFTVALLIAGYGGLVGGLFGGPVTALQAEVLPSDETGAPLNASRDMNLIGLAWALPGLFLPMGLAHMYKVFADPYRAFFLVGAVIMTVQSPILLGVRPKLTERERNTPRRKLVAQISALELERREGKITQSEFETQRARILLREQMPRGKDGADGDDEDRLRRDVPPGAACCDRLLFGAGGGIVEVRQRRKSEAQERLLSGL